MSAFSFRSTNSFSPTMPMSATPLAMVCGMSSSRWKSTYTGKLLAWVSKVRLEVEILMSASLNRAMVSSNRRPFDCTAILNIIVYRFFYDS